MDQNIVKICKTFEPIMQFWSSSMFIILRTILTQIQKPDTLAIMDYNFCDIQTDMVKTQWEGTNT